MLSLVIVLHIIISILLITIILMQSGRGGGLTESLAAGAESIFGSKTNAFMVRTTTVLAILFLLTTLSLAFLSTQRNKSLMEKKSVQNKVAVTPIASPVNKEAVTLPVKEEPKKEDIVPTPTHSTTK